MACRCGGTFLAPLLAIAGLSAVGAAGYHMVSGQCCLSGGDQTKIVTTSTQETPSCSLCPGAAETVAMTETKADGCCPFTNDAAAKNVAMSEPKADGCCAAGKEAAAIKTVAATTEAKAGCCAAKGETVCKDGKEGCTGSGENGCCGKCSDEKKTDGSVASSGK